MSVLGRERGSGCVVHWDNWSGELFAGGNSDVVRAWDAGSQRCSSCFATNENSCVTRMRSHAPGGGVLLVGHGNGAIRVVDRRAARRAAQASSGTGFVGLHSHVAIGSGMWLGGHGGWRAQGSS